MNSVYNQVCREGRLQYWDQVESQSYLQVGDQAWRNVRHEVWDQVGNQVYRQVCHEIRKQTR